jgi:hypothetical protein
MNLRKLARDQPCMVRIPGICNFDPTTTVLAHIRRGGVGGMGIKPPDLCGVWACSSCHDVIDGRRVSEVPDGELEEYILDALCRTLAKVSERL